MPQWSILRLAKSHDRTAFDCGVPLLNQWLKECASQFDRRDLARTYVAIPSDEPTLCGYYAVSMHRVLYEALPPSEAKGLPRIDIPVMLLGRLAVDLRWHGHGLGSHLLIDALRRAAQIADQVGLRAVEVDAMDDGAKRFYSKFGFRPLLDDDRHLFLPMHEIRKLKLV